MGTSGQPVFLPIGNGFYVDESLPLSAQECVNWYVSIPETPSLSEAVLRGTSGIDLLTTTGTLNEANRGGYVMNGIPYVVNGTTLYRIDRTVSGDDITYSTTTLGQIQGTGRVSMADNGKELCIVVPGDPSTGHIFTETSGVLQTITDTDFKANGEPQHVVYVDSYFLFTTNSKKFIVSNPNQGLVYSALDFGTAEADPDDIVAPIVFKNQVFIGGTETMEGFENIGGAGFPFQRNGLYIAKGLSAPFSVSLTSDTFLFIGQGTNESPSIWAFTGSSVQKISTIPIDTLLGSFSMDEVQSSFSWSYSSRGAFFVGFSFPTTTLVYDLISGKWHERRSQRVDELGVTVTERFRVNSMLQAYGSILVADKVDGRIGEIRTDSYKEYGNPIIRKFSTQPFINKLMDYKVPKIELVVESGVGNVDKKDPVIRMERSVDGGRTWTLTRSRKMGKVGDYKRRCIWRRNGHVATSEVFRFTLSDPVKPVILLLKAEVVGG